MKRVEYKIVTRSEQVEKSKNSRLSTLEGLKKYLQDKNYYSDEYSFKILEGLKFDGTGVIDYNIEVYFSNRDNDKIDEFKISPSIYREAVEVFSNIQDKEKRLSKVAEIIGTLFGAAGNQFVNK